MAQGAADARRGAALVLLAAVLWGTLGVVFRWLGDAGLPATGIGFWRATVAASALALALALRDRAALRVEARHLGFFALYGLVSVALLFSVYPLAVRLSSVAVSVVLLYTAPAWVALMGAVFLGEALTGRKGAALVGCFVGTALVAGILDPGSLRAGLPGIAAGLASGFTYATMSIFARKAPPRYGTPTMMLYTLGFGALFLAAPAAAEPGGLLGPVSTPRGALLLLYTGVVPTAGSMSLYVGGLRLLGDAGRASLLATLEPLVASLLGFLVLGEALSSAQVLGGALVLGSVLSLQAGSGRE